jgi:eukaryotic-like serine/threonine-protein kinase
MCQGVPVSMTSARLLGGRYQLHTMLGRGGVAAVWAGIDTKLDRPVAVKTLESAALADPVMVQRLDREARTVARLAHPNIVAMYDMGTDGGLPFLVMELVDGEDLQHRLLRGPLSIEQSVQIAAQICDALHAAHEAGVVHRDIKPANILLTRAGVVKVCDFGIARLQREAQVHLTSSATTIGTSEYMAPEQAAGGPVDARTDLYALGCLLYAMLTGGPPFSGDNPMRVLWQQVHEPPPSASSRRMGIPADLDAIVTQLLAKHPADRPDGALQVRTRLGHLADLAAGAASLSAVSAAAGSGSPTAVRARAAVATRTMPAVDVPSEKPAGRTGFRVGPAGIAAVAVGAAAVTALVIAILAAGGAAQPSAAPTADATGTVSTAATTAPATATTSTVLAAIQAQVNAGQLDAGDAKDLTGKLDDVDRNIARGRTGEAAQKLNDVRDRLAELRDDHKITNAGYSAILAAIDQLSRALANGGDHSGTNN